MNWCSNVPTRYPNIAMKLGISIVGAGRIGRALGRRLREQGWRIHSVVTRSESTARRAVRSIGGGAARGELSQSIFSAPVILIAVLRLVNDRELMGRRVNGPWYNLAAWATAIVVSASSLLLIGVTIFS